MKRNNGETLEKQITLRLTPEMYKKLETVAAKRDRSMGYINRKALEFYFSNVEFEDDS